MTETTDTATNDSLCFDTAAAAAEPAPLPHPTANPTRSFWLDTSTAPPSDPTTPAAVDVAIIGSGITGVSAAFHLAHRSDLPASIASVAVFEAREFCSGATARNGGHLTPASALAYSDLASNPSHLARNIDAIEPASKRTAAETVRRILALEARTATDLTLIVDTHNQSLAGTQDVELVNRRNWHLCFSAAEEAAFDGSLVSATVAGLIDYVRLVRKVDKDECDRTLDRPAGIRCAYDIPGSTVHPRRLVALLWKLALQGARQRTQALSLSLHTHTPIERISSASDDGSSRYRTLHLSGGRAIRARYLIHATNAYVSHLVPQLAGSQAPQAGTAKHSSFGVVPTRAQCIAALPAASQETNWEMGFSLHQGFEYLHQRPRRSSHTTASSSPLDEATPPPFIFGGGRYFSETMEYGESNDGAVHPLISRFLRSFLPSTFPRTFHTSKSDTAPANDSKPEVLHRLAPVSHEWTGIIGMTRSKDPLVGPVPSSDEPTSKAVPRQYMAAGYSGHGMTRAFACARLVVDMLLADERGALDQWTLPDDFPACYLTMLPGKRRPVS